MKVKPEHYEVLKSTIAETHNGMDVKAIREHYNANGLNYTRFVCDMAYRAKLSHYICDNIYPYANDDHLLTAYKKVAKELYNITE